ncbi:MAG TPA: Arm DNA-binding domain-containing protein, partial [Oculatellaceae cyanobacterium]
MRGHVYQRGKTWTYVIDLPRDPVTGKRRQKSKGGFKTEKEAWAACRNEIARIEKGQNVQDENMLYRDFLGIWLEEYAKSKLKPTVYETNKQIIEKRIVPELGNLKLRELTPLRIQRFYNKLLGTYSPDYVKTIHSVVS